MKGEEVTVKIQADLKRDAGVLEMTDKCHGYFKEQKACSVRDDGVKGKNNDMEERLNNWHMAQSNRKQEEWIKEGEVEVVHHIRGSPREEELEESGMLNPTTEEPSSAFSAFTLPISLSVTIARYGG